ncbi:error-prone DNA polymerase [Inhella inkyongensis]|uniref:error-prone DNA polymerase n=1 Tax=Inhella inkyongensis TaxID=392593 RepID=UPI001FE2B5C5|nr:error-prone DNA polymerase [Inhella inkyongensis]
MDAGTPPSPHAPHPLHPPQAALQVLSNFSFLRGASHPRELVQRAAELGLGALALTDDCSLSGVVQAHLQALQHAQVQPGLKLLIGARFDVQRSAPGRARAAQRPPDAPDAGLDEGLNLPAPDSAPLFRLVLLAASREGYGNLSQFITDLRCASPKGQYHLDWRGIQPQHLGGLLAIALPSRRARDAELLGLGAWLLKHFAGRAWLGVDLQHQLDDARWCQRLRWLSDSTALPLVAAPQVLMHRAQRKPLQDVMTAIRLRLPLSECGQRLEPNASAHLRRLDAPNSPYAPEWIAQTAVIAARCHFSLDEIRYEYPAEVVPPGLTPGAHLAALTSAGAAQRWPAGVPPQVQAQLHKELALIAQLRYEHYFLTVADIVHFARGRGILCQGRGSAANSAVCYALGITEVDPARGNCLLERFISLERDEPPDIDVDFEHQRREEVIQYLYAKYGRRRAGLTAVVTRYRPRSALRDVGKALGLAPELIERLAKAHHGWGNDLQLDGANLGVDLSADPRLPLLRRWAGELIDMPRHLSQHVGGFVLTRGLLSRLVPVENAAMANRTVIQWEKNDLEALGLMKVDVLALGMLSCLRRALDLLGLKQGRGLERGRPMRLQDIPAEDPATYAMLRRADTVGVFQVESRAQMAMLPRLKPRCFYDLVVQVAIVRPGPIQGGMVHPYLKRRQGLEAPDYYSEALKPALARTLGVPIFQEQVMQVAMIAAGFSGGEADQLRRGMAAWTRHGDLSPFRQRLFDGMRERGYPQEFAERIDAQIQGFAEYGFPESHAASFALLTYASSWIKCHHPAVFLVALLNSQPLGFYTPSQLVQDALRHGITVRPPCVNASFWESTLEEDGAVPAVRLGLHLIRDLHHRAARAVVVAREGEGSARTLTTPPGEADDLARRGPYRPPESNHRPFTSTADLARRAGLSRADLNALAAGDALAALSGQRRLQRWDAAALERLPALLQDAAPEDDAGPESTPNLPAAPEGEEVLWDYQSLGLTLRSHPLALLRPALQRLGYADGETLSRLPNRRLARAVGIVTNRQQPGTAKGVTFLSLEDEHGSVQVIVWRKVRLQFRAELLQARLLGVWGIWQREAGVCHLIAHRLVDLSEHLGQLPTRSRDFH